MYSFKNTTFYKRVLFLHNCLVDNQMHIREKHCEKYVV